MTPDEIMTAEVSRWRGTPFAANGDTPGLKGGVSCQKLVGAIFAARGITAEVPEGIISEWRFAHESLIEKFMDARPDFDPLPADPDDVRAWDILGFKLGRVIHHVGVSVGPYQFVHVIEGQGVSVASLYDATWLTRFVKIWRLK